MSAVVTFPFDEARRHTNRARLAEYLRELADLIETNEVEIEPTAALIVLTGERTHEVVCCGYEDDQWGYEGASRTAYFVAQSTSFPTIGQNRRDRGDYVARPMKHNNIVDGAFPRASRKEPADV